MISLVLILASITISQGFTLQNLSPKIVNGSNALIEDYPYQISLEHYGFHRCGGTIIGKRHVVTAAHCTDDANVSRLKIRAGSTFKEIDGQLVQVEKLFQHPNYNRINKNNDISVLQLAEDITHPSAKAALLPNDDFILPIGEYGDVTGWGRLNETQPGPLQLQVIEMPILSLDVCKKSYGGVITENMICAGYIEGGMDSCQGDSGGPFVLDGTLIGIVSWGRGCARPKFPGVYASVPKLRSYIRETSGL